MLVKKLIDVLREIIRIEEKRRYMPSYLMKNGILALKLYGTVMSVKYSFHNRIMISMGPIIFRYFSSDI